MLARAGRVVERGTEPDLALCLMAAAFGLTPSAEIAIEFRGTPAGTYIASRLQAEPSAVTYSIMKEIGGDVQPNGD